MQDHLRPKPTDCAVCGTEFDASKRNRGKGRQRYCTTACRQRADTVRHYRRRLVARVPEEMQRECTICGVRFQTSSHHPNALTCSVKCNQARMDRVRRQERAKNADLSGRSCEECGALYTPHQRAAHKQRFCSKKCQNRVMQRRLREAQPRTFDPRLRTSKWKIASKAAVERAGGKCQSCGASDCRLSVHHKFHRTQAEREDHSDTNLIVLCGTCHSVMHDIQIGRQDGKTVISGLVFRLLGITEVQIV